MNLLNSSQPSSGTGLNNFFSSKSLLIGAAALMAYGIARRSKTSMALAATGGILAANASRSSSKPQAAHTRATFLVNATPEQAYRLWRDFSNLARFMRHVKSVQVQDDTHSEWVVLGPMDREIRWTAEIIEDVNSARSCAKDDKAEQAET